MAKEKKKEKKEKKHKKSGERQEDRKLSEVKWSCVRCGDHGTKTGWRAAFLAATQHNTEAHKGEAAGSLVYEEVET